MSENPMVDSKYDESASMLLKMTLVQSATILKKMIIIYCLTLNIWQPSWILPTMQWHKVFSGHTTMSGVPGNPMVDTKITNLLLFCRQLYKFIVWPCTNGGHLGFCRHFSNIENPTHFHENSLFEDLLYRISSFYVNLKLVFSYKAH